MLHYLYTLLKDIQKASNPSINLKLFLRNFNVSILIKEIDMQFFPFANFAECCLLNDR